MFLPLVALSSLAVVMAGQSGEWLKGNYGVASSNDAPALNPVIIAVPVQGKAVRNVPEFTNVRKGRHHGRFFDQFIKNRRHSRSSSSDSDSDSDSDSSSSSRHRHHKRHGRHGRRHHRGGVQTYGTYGGYGNYGQYPSRYVSNPFFVNKSHRRHGRRHSRSSSSSGSSSDSSN